MQTLILDSSQISNALSCLQSWANRGLIAINKKCPEETLRPGDALAAGSLGHKYLEIYYHELAKSGDPALSAKVALAFDPDKEDLVDKQFPLDAELREKVRLRVIDYLLYYNQKDYVPAHKKVHSVIVKKVCRLCNTVVNGKPLPLNGCPHEVVERLCDSFEKDPLIEKGFSYKLFESPEYLFVLEGRIDFMGEASDGTLLWMDHKFQFRKHNLYHKSIQFKNYSLATGLNLAVINYIRLTEKVDKETFVRQPLSFSSLEMRHWKQELTDIYVGIAKTIADPNYYLNDGLTYSRSQNRGSCAGAWGKSCQYAPLCEEYNPQIRAAVQKRDFMPRKEWRPWLWILGGIFVKMLLFGGSLKI